MDVCPITHFYYFYQLSCTRRRKKKEKKNLATQKRYESSQLHVTMSGRPKPAGRGGGGTEARTVSKTRAGGLLCTTYLLTVYREKELRDRERERCRLLSQKAHHDCCGARYCDTALEFVLRRHAYF